jgi:tetratricopeptide (TPR) repeat protein
LPVIVSDYVDTSDGWLTKAETAAHSAQTIDELAGVISFCEKGLQAKPVREIDFALRRLAAWAHTRRGELLAESEQAQAAFVEFEKAISLDATCSLALHNRAVSFAQQGRTAEALRDFGRVIALNPGLAVAYRNRGELFASLNRWQDAIDDYERALVQLPHDTDLLRARAAAWQRLQNFERAQSDLNQALQIAPDEAQSFVQRAGLAAGRGDFGAAVSDYQRAIELAPEQVDGYRGLAWLLATCADPAHRDPEQAVTVAKRGLALANDADPYLLDALAAAHAGVGQFELATGAARQALEAAPRDLATSLRERLALYERRQVYVELRGASTVAPANFEIQLPMD